MPPENEDPLQRLRPSIVEIMSDKEEDSRTRYWICCNE